MMRRSLRNSSSVIGFSATSTSRWRVRPGGYPTTAAGRSQIEAARGYTARPGENDLGERPTGPGADSGADGAEGGHGLSPDAAAFLARSGRAFLITLRADGSPTAHPMTALVADDRLAYNTYRKSAKARNATRDPRTCSLLLEDYEPSLDRALVYKGRAREIDPARAELKRRAPAQPTRQLSTTVPDRANARLEEGKRMLLSIDPDEALLIGDGSD